MNILAFFRKAGFEGRGSFWCLIWAVNRGLRGWKSCVCHQLYHLPTENAWGSPPFYASKYPSLHIKEKGTDDSGCVSVYLICQASLQSRIIPPTNSSLLSRTTHSLSWAISTTEDTGPHPQCPQWPRENCECPKDICKGQRYFQEYAGNLEDWGHCPGLFHP